MNTSESHTEQQEAFTKAKILNRVIAKSIDFLIMAALLEIIPKAGYFIGLAYLLIGDGLFEGRSAGKKLIGTRVVLRETGQPCSFRESIIRNFIFAIGYMIYGILRIVPLIGPFFAIIIMVIILALESLIMLGNEKGMRLGDELAGTRVVEGAVTVEVTN